MLSKIEYFNVLILLKKEREYVVMEDYFYIRGFFPLTENNYLFPKCSLTTSNLPWFMDLILQVPIQYCSLQHWTLLLSPVPSTAGYCFCFGSIPSFFLELFFHWSPVAYWTPNDLRCSSFSVIYFCLCWGDQIECWLFWWGHREWQ